MSTSQIKEW